jgi:hypothetical protein
MVPAVRLPLGLPHNAHGIRGEHVPQPQDADVEVARVDQGGWLVERLPCRGRVAHLRNVLTRQAHRQQCR